MQKNIRVFLVSSARQAYSVLQKAWRNLITLPIRVYQLTLSFDHGPMKALYPHGFCPYHPSCSEYTRQAILKKGVVVGVVRGSWRILRCNPWTKGGVDLP